MNTIIYLNILLTIIFYFKFIVILGTRVHIMNNLCCILLLMYIKGIMPLAKGNAQGTTCVLHFKLRLGLSINNKYVSWSTLAHFMAHWPIYEKYWNTIQKSKLYKNHMRIKSGIGFCWVPISEQRLAGLSFNGHMKQYWIIQFIRRYTLVERETYDLAMGLEQGMACLSQSASDIEYQNLFIKKIVKYKYG